MPPSNVSSTPQMFHSQTIFSVKDAKLTDQFYTQLGFTPTWPNKDPKLASFLFGEDKCVIHFFEQGSKIDEFLTPGSKYNSQIIFPKNLLISISSEAMPGPAHRIASNLNKLI
jgi:predicted lactoylglutathione lyase